MYRYFSDTHTDANGLKVEIQFRSQLQHVWATAVETVETLINESFKSGQGDEEWLRFFSLMASEIAFQEKSPAVPNTPSSNKALRAELRDYATHLNVSNRLRAFGEALHILNSNPVPYNPYYFVLVLKPGCGSTSVSSYGKKDFDMAASQYIDIENASQQSSTNAVLILASSEDSLRRAYPNYFLDTKMFIDDLESAVR